MLTLRWRRGASPPVWRLHMTLGNSGFTAPLTRSPILAATESAVVGRIVDLSTMADPSGMPHAIEAAVSTAMKQSSVGLTACLASSAKVRVPLRKPSPIRASSPGSPNGARPSRRSRSREASRSQQTTRLPASANTAATGRPTCPPPITVMSMLGRPVPLLPRRGLYPQPGGGMPGQVGCVRLGWIGGSLRGGIRVAAVLASTSGARPSRCPVLVVVGAQGVARKARSTRCFSQAHVVPRR